MYLILDTYTIYCSYLYFITCTLWPITWCMSSLVTSYFHWYATACFILVHVLYLCYAYFLIVHYAWLTLRGHWTLGFYYIIIAISLLQTVSFMFPFNTCISSNFHYVITWPLGMLLPSKNHLLWHDLPWLISISWLDWLLVGYHHLVMLSLYTQHDTLFSLATLLLYHSIDYDSILALVFMYCISCFISFIALCYAWPTLRGRWTCWTGTIAFTLPLGIILDLSVCATIYHMYITWQLCYHLTTCHATIWQDPFIMSWLTWLLSILDMLGCLLNITTLSCYHLTLSMMTRLVIVIFTGILICYPVSWSVTGILYSCFTCSDLTI